MAACDEWKETLVDLVFGEVADETEIRLNDHLLSCPACREKEERLIALRNQVRGDEARPGAELKARVRAALPMRAGQGAGVILRRPVPAYVAVAAGLLGAFLVLILPGGDRGRLLPANVASRPERIAAGAEPYRFSVAGSYETGVRPAEYETSPSDSSIPTHPQSEDSL
jgi:anti-sigma factor RsiW